MQREQSQFRHIVCPKFQHSIELIGKRWSGAVIDALFAGAVRFTDISSAVPGLSDRLLSERLKELEQEGIVERIVHDNVPARIEYRLTEMGMDLQASFRAIGDWAETWMEIIPDDEA